MAERPNHPHRVPLAPDPLSASPRGGVQAAREDARRFLPNVVRLLAGIALAEGSEAALHTKMLAAKEIALIAGIPQPTPSLPQDEGGGGGEPT